MKMVVFSDVHYGPAEIGFNAAGVKRKLTQFCLPLMEKLTNKINNEIKPDIVINLGDMIEDLKDHDSDINNLKYIWNEFQKIEPPFYSVTGNHDLRTLSREEVQEVMGYPNSTFSVDIAGCHFVILGLSPNETKSDAEGGIIRTRMLSNQDLNWLKEDIKNNNLPSFVFLHYGVAEDDMKGNWWFEGQKENALLQNRKELKEILRADNNLVAVFSGHQHWTKEITEDEINYFVLGSMTEDIKMNGIPEGIWLEAEFNNGKLTTKYHNIEL